MSPTKSEPLKIVVLSGGTGRTGRQVVEAALAQFVEPNVQLVVEPNVRSATKASEIVRQAKSDGAVICHTLVEPTVRHAVAQQSGILVVPVVDLLGPVITLLSDHLDVEPRNQPGLSYTLNKEQFDRLDAVDFNLAHDDGRRPEGYDQADVVLVGASRVSKSVTALYLAYQGIRAANVPIAPEIEPPEQLFQLDPAKVVALTMSVKRLQRLREVRGENWGEAMTAYTDPRRIARELQKVDRLVTEHGWHYIDVSFKAVEEVTSEIIRLLGFDTRVVT